MNLHTALNKSVQLINQPGTITFEFEELPLIVSDAGFEMAPVSGKAEIEYRGFYDFEVRHIYLDALKTKSADELRADPSSLHIRKQIKLSIQEHRFLWCAIAEQLDNGSFKGAVESAIFRELEKEAA